jgi:hypothetical protein
MELRIPFNVVAVKDDVLIELVLLCRRGQIGSRDLAWQGGGRSGRSLVLPHRVEPIAKVHGAIVTQSKQQQGTNIGGRLHHGATSR